MPSSNAVSLMKRRAVFVMPGVGHREVKPILLHRDGLRNPSALMSTFVLRHLSQHPCSLAGAQWGWIPLTCSSHQPFAAACLCVLSSAAGMGVLRPLKFWGVQHPPARLQESPWHSWASALPPEIWPSQCSLCSDALFG